jgi:putative membrane protein
MINMTPGAILAAAIALVLVLLLVPLLVMRMMPGMGNMMGFGGMMGQPGSAGPMSWTGWLTMFFWLLLIVGVILLIVWGVRQLAGRSTGAQERPLAILQQRYARGEISSEEYERIRVDLLRDGREQ